MGILATLSGTKKLFLAGGMIVFASCILALSLQSTNAGSSAFTLPSTAQQPMSKFVLREMIPGNPMYALYMARDRIVLELTKDPVQNGLLRVEYANRRMETAKILIDRDETAAAVSTLAKAQIYMGKAVELFTTYDQSKLPQLKVQLLEHRKQLEAAKAHLINADPSRLDDLIGFNASLIQTISRY